MLKNVCYFYYFAIYICYILNRVRPIFEGGIFFLPHTFVFGKCILYDDCIYAGGHHLFSSFGAFLFSLFLLSTV